MHIISHKKLREASREHPDLAAPLDVWYRISKKSAWKSLVDTRKQFPTADLIGSITVFNIKGNEYRLIAQIFYAEQTVLVRAVLTHAEYDRERWK
jgi:mRNA interferase HigB